MAMFVRSKNEMALKTKSQKQRKYLIVNSCNGCSDGHKVSGSTGH